MLTGNKSANTSTKSGVGNGQAALSKLVDQAVEEVANTVAQQIDAKASSIQAASTPAISIKVAGVTNKEVFINKGKLSGMTAGSTLQSSELRTQGSKIPIPERALQSVKSSVRLSSKILTTRPLAARVAAIRLRRQATCRTDEEVTVCCPGP